MGRAMGSTPRPPEPATAPQDFLPFRARFRARSPSPPRSPSRSTRSRATPSREPLSISSFVLSAPLRCDNARKRPRARPHALDAPDPLIVAPESNRRDPPNRCWRHAKSARRIKPLLTRWQWSWRGRLGHLYGARQANKAVSALARKLPDARIARAPSAYVRVRWGRRKAPGWGPGPERPSRRWDRRPLGRASHRGAGRGGRR